MKPSTNNVFRGCENLLATCIKKIDVRRDETPREKGKFSVLVNRIKDELPSNGLNILMKFSMKKSDDYKNEWEVKNQNIKNLEKNLFEMSHKLKELKKGLADKNNIFAEIFIIIQSFFKIQGVGTDN